MFVVSISYTAPADKIASLRQGHLEWLKEAFARGNMTMAGPKSSKDGGILLTCHPDRAALEAELDRDPYRIHNVATQDIVEFDATMTG